MNYLKEKNNNKNNINNNNENPFNNNKINEIMEENKELKNEI